ncbi:MAG: QacE family quaternary ammonium compound efflux SMR transporter [Legionellales bacterium]|nr:QacE family quaternary ammonium compound efflux SMR transporter [Legionellales bacterium]|tara:strand:- start:1369 stop:1692 length:324 start_codon:yes stop_codon:yes gene_type:complete
MEKAYLTLALAILLEVTGTLLLPVSQNMTRILPSLSILAAYTSSIYLLALVSQKLPLAIIYSTWSGTGIFMVSILSAVIYRQTLNWRVALGLVLITIGVIIVNTFKN